MNPWTLENTYHKIYHEDCDEFKRVRELCLLEDNWLRHNYTVDKLKIEEHKGYSVIYEKGTDRPMMMAGVYPNPNWPNNVARMVSRLYLFPEFRCSRANMLDSYIICHERIIKPLIDINNYDIYVITMQNRTRPGKGWWRLWLKMMRESSNSMWTEPNGYIQSCPWMVDKCWQNFVYHERRVGAWSEWNPQILSEEDWLLLPPGK